MIINENEFVTSDLSLAATLSLWFPIDCIDKIDQRRVKFNFIRNDQLEQTLEAFWKRELRVDPLTYFEQIKAIKSRIYEEK